MSEPTDPIERQRDEARTHADGPFQEAMAGMGTGAVPAPVEVSMAPPPPGEEPDSPASGGSPEHHPRPTFRSSQLDGLEEEHR